VFAQHRLHPGRRCCVDQFRRLRQLGIKVERDVVEHRRQWLGRGLGGQGLVCFGGRCIGRRFACGHLARAVGHAGQAAEVDIGQQLRRSGFSDGLGSGRFIPAKVDVQRRGVGKSGHSLRPCWRLVCGDHGQGSRFIGNRHVGFGRDAFARRILG